MSLVQVGHVPGPGWTCPWPSSSGQANDRAEASLCSFTWDWPMAPRRGRRHVRSLTAACWWCWGSGLCTRVLAITWQSCGNRVAIRWQSGLFFGNRHFGPFWAYENICVFYNPSDTEVRPTCPLYNIKSEKRHFQQFLLLWSDAASDGFNFRILPGPVPVSSQGIAILFF